MCHRPALLAVLAAALAAPRADAALVTYTFDGTLTGTLGGTPFTDAPVEFTLTADTAGITTALETATTRVLVTAPATLSFTIDGVSGTFLDPFQVVGNTFAPGGLGTFPALGSGGLTPAPGGSVSNDLLDIRLRDLAYYDLSAPAGPFTQSPPNFLNPGEAYPTTAGDLILEDTGDETLTFRASLAPAAVPEPAALGLAAAGAAGLLGWARRRRATA
ncbi:MAG: PEP-CTERM sorting domain-containing protein [Gemmataceae bacterium]|nr:PEP-CTERM sorting domain-containing protein [Gemmataceae bacterium]